MLPLNRTSLRMYVLHLLDQSQAWRDRPIDFNCSIGTIRTTHILNFRFYLLLFFWPKTWLFDTCMWHWIGTLVFHIDDLNTILIISHEAHGIRAIMGDPLKSYFLDITYGIQLEVWEHDLTLSGKVLVWVGLRILNEESIWHTRAYLIYKNPE